ncbi:hypothetical protein L21SP5_01860 [Salinivirga cyanobacteriivorans]|uniref:TonB C-terminal domain-containing protein n=1 Tax=Salinivirga cyanobacteriivorans TaxID=1307839 RepID=A0A0S2I0H1_9BACT|nr:hypothetical protein [Salinivirga cyanobacteriivorans]ALO15500.1 hypothetical protein L21SP5_01860 [Salinivirga cyanobacteriivorans]
MGKRKLSYNHFKKYFGNRQKSEERHAFERDMMQDAFDEEAFDGLSQLSSEELEADIEKLKMHIDQRSHKRSRTIPLWLGYAAGIAILAGVGSVTFFMLNEELKDDIAYSEPLNEKIAMSDTSPEEEPKKIEEESATPSEKGAQTTAESGGLGAKGTVETVTQSKEKQDDQMLEMTEFVADDEMLTDELDIAAEEEIKKEDQTEKVTESLSEMAFAGAQPKAETTSTDQAELSGKNLAPTSGTVDALAGVATEEKTTSRAKREKATPTDHVAQPPGSMTLKSYKKELAKRILEHSITNQNFDLTLFIETTGKVYRVETKADLVDDQKIEIRKLIDSLGPWRPAIKTGDKVPSKVHIEIIFDIE